MTIENYLNTSVHDCQVSLQFVTDLEFLRLLLARCLRMEMKTKSQIVVRRIKQIERKKGIRGKTSKEKTMKIIDRKFQLLAVNPVNGKIYTEENAMVFCAKDKAVPAALQAYLVECARIGANHEHLESVGLLIERVVEYQRSIESRVPDTVGDEIQRCISGIYF